MPVLEVGDIVRISGTHSAGEVEIVHIRSDGLHLVIIPRSAGFGWSIDREFSWTGEYSELHARFTGQLGWWIRPGEAVLVRKGARKGKGGRRRKPKPLRNRVCRAICETLMGGLVSSGKT